MRETPTGLHTAPMDQIATPGSSAPVVLDFQAIAAAAPASVRDRMVGILETPEGQARLTEAAHFFDRKVDLAQRMYLAKLRLEKQTRRLENLDRDIPETEAYIEEDMVAIATALKRKADFEGYGDPAKYHRSIETEDHNIIVKKGYLAEKQVRLEQYRASIPVLQAEIADCESQIIQLPLEMAARTQEEKEWLGHIPEEQRVVLDQALVVRGYLEQREDIDTVKVKQTDFFQRFSQFASAVSKVRTGDSILNTLIAPVNNQRRLMNGAQHLGRVTAFAEGKLTMSSLDPGQQQIATEQIKEALFNFRVLTSAEVEDLKNFNQRNYIEKEAWRAFDPYYSEYANNEGNIKMCDPANAEDVARTERAKVWLDHLRDIKPKLDALLASVKLELIPIIVGQTVFSGEYYRGVGQTHINHLPDSVVTAVIVNGLRSKDTNEAVSDFPEVLVNRHR